MSVAKPQLLVRDSSGTTKATLEADSAERTDEYRKMTRGQAVVDAGAWNKTSLDSRNDELVIRRPDGTDLLVGRYDDDEREGDATVVKVVSFERDAIDAKPTGSNLIVQNTADSTVIQNRLVDEVSTLSAGTIDTLAPSLSYSFPNSARSQVGKTVAVATGGELRYNNDKTVDYKGRLGSDLGITISPDNRNVVGEPRVTRDVRDEVTHIRGFGAGSGPDQVTAEAVAPGYAGGKQVWREFEDTDIKEQSRLQTVIDRLVSELDGEPRKTTVATTLVDVDVQLGDRLQVTLPDRGIDRMLRITKLTERFAEKGQEYIATLTNRQVDEDLNGNPREDVQRFNRGYQGFLDRDTQVSGWNNAGDGTPQTLVVPSWPDDIVREDTVKLVVQGRAWRAPLDIQSHDHDFEVTHPTHDHEFTLSDHVHEVIVNAVADAAQGSDIGSITGGIGSTTVDDTRTTLDSRAYLGDSLWKVTAFARLEADSATDLEMRIFNATQSTFTGWVTATDADTVGFGYVELPVGAIAPGDNIRLEARTGGSTVTVGHDVTWHFVENHNHAVADTVTSEAGGGTTTTSDTSLGTTESRTSSAVTPATPSVVTSFGGESYYPSEVDVKVDGQTVTTLSGDDSQDWQETVDLRGELSAGQQTITAEPTGQRGEINLTLQSELFRQGPSTN